MQFFNSPLVCIAVLATMAAATPVGSALQPRAGTPCTSAQRQLNDGIAKNIEVQKNEQSAVDAIDKALQQKGLTDAQFKPLKDKLVGFVNQGITIREANQKIDTKSKAAAGLAKVATAQAAELKLAEGLTGKQATDQESVATLKKDFAGGIDQNKQNQKDALDNCVL